jgi:hypothetical protein
VLQRPIRVTAISLTARREAHLRTAIVRTFSTYRPDTCGIGIALGLLCAFAGGCSPGIRWRGFSFAPVLAESQRDQKLTFVYFRDWAVVACTDFEENVLKHPAVLEALRPNGAFYCVPLQFTWDRPLAEQWGVELPPAVVIVDPEERLLLRLSGEISVEQLLDAIEAAKEEFPAATQPARAP